MLLFHFEAQEDCRFVNWKDPLPIGMAIIRSGGSITTDDGTVIMSVNSSGQPFIGELGSSVKVTGALYWNESGSTNKTVKAHNHDSTSTVGAEFKYDSAIASGATYGLWADNNIGLNGTASATAILGVATVETGVTCTGGTLIGTYGQARANGTVAGSAFMAGLYGLIEASAAITASHVCSAWLDSHQANAVTGSHQLLYMTNNGAATMDEAIYIYGGDKISNLMELNTVSGMTNASNGGGSDVYINFTIDGTAARLAAKYVA